MRRISSDDIDGSKYVAFMSALKKKVHWTCKRCGWFCPANEKGEIVVHHIDRRFWNNTPDNLVVLCRDCHDIVHDRPLSPRRKKIVRRRALETAKRSHPRRQYDDKGWPIRV